MGPIAEKFEKWRRWVQSIQEDVETSLVHPRQVFREFAKRINANTEHIEEHDGDVFCYFVRECYVSHVAMAIRRQVKVKRESVSLLGLLQEILKCSSQFTYQFYLQNFPIDPNYVEWQPSTFAEFSGDGVTVTDSIVQKDIRNLEAITIKVEDLADKSIAHLDKAGPGGSVTFGDLNACIDAFDHLVCKYLKLITGGGYTTLETKILSNWTQIFTVPLDIRGQTMDRSEG